MSLEIIRTYERFKQAVHSRDDGKRIPKRRLVEGTPEEAWSPPNGCYTAPAWSIYGRHPAYRSYRCLSGVSFTQVEGDKIRSERTYLGRQTVAEQLGLKAK
jgi:hypothetical protein